MRKRSAVEGAIDLLAKAEMGEDPWLLSYADLVTNLLAFMVVLVSLAGISFEAIDKVPSMFSAWKQKEAPPLETLSSEIEKLAEQEGLTGKVKAAVDTNGLAIHLQDRILFPSGVATLSEPGERLVEKLARLLNNLPETYLVAVEGHTDDVPIATARFASNWELSAGRALEVRKTLARFGVNDRRLSIMAYADTRPAESPPGAPLDEIRARNRRVVIRVYY